jgi:hypothetical protein
MRAAGRVTVDGRERRRRDRRGAESELLEEFVHPGSVDCNAEEKSEGRERDG